MTLDTIDVIDYQERFNVGKAKYVVSYCTGKEKHADGSDFYDIRIFRSRKAKDAFIATLKVVKAVAS